MQQECRLDSHILVFYTANRQFASFKPPRNSEKTADLLPSVRHSSKEIIKTGSDRLVIRAFFVLLRPFLLVTYYQLFITS